MTETQRRIKEYKAKLPGLKERVIAVALLLAMSFSMVVSASFAWFTLSQAPEVSLMSTTVAANGNLEIALAQTSYAYQTDADGNLVVDTNGNNVLIPVVVPPDESAVGDSSAAEGNTLVNSNTKWGNLVNLSDSSYGLQQISLRPARLNGYNLTRTPLYGATYSADGRVYDVSENYMYASWKADAEKPYFAAGEESTYGVRAISSVKFENITGTSNINTMQARITSAYDTAITIYENIVNGTTKIVDGTDCMTALAGLIQIYAQEKADKMLADDPTTVPDADYSKYVTYTYNLIAEFWKILEAEGEALVYMANLQIYMKGGNAGTETFKTVDELLTAYTNGTLASYGVKIDSLDSFKRNYEAVKGALTDNPNNDRDLYSLAIGCDPLTVTNPEPVYWREIGGYVAILVDIPSTTIQGTEIGKLSKSAILGMTGVLMGSEVATVVIQKGALVDTEKRLDNTLGRLGTRVTIRLKALGFNANVKANVSTTAKAPFIKNLDQEYTMSADTSGMSGDATAKDTYGMAIDFWVRTNVENSHLMLEGNVIYEAEDAIITNKNGEETRLYLMTDAEGNKVDVYQFEDDAVDEEGNPTGEKVLNWYNANSHTVVGSNTELGDAGCSFEAQSINVVVGYQGENRIWENWEELLEAGFISEDNTTQGAGSCYIFYADNPTDQTRILDLLKTFTIAFIDEEGNHIATAKLDTEHHYAINGKVTVPLQMISGATCVIVDEITKEETEYTSITPLEANKPKLITAIVYLDGSMLANDNVLAAGEIEGRLNLQFGSSVNLTAGKDNELQAKYRTITAMASAEVNGETKITYNKTDAIEYEYNGKTKTVKVTLLVEGDKPTNVSGFFVKAISQTQGSRSETQTFEDNGDGTWSATFELAKPGDYSFNSVIVDGSEYVFDDTPTIKIAGLAITSLNCDYASGMIMTADNYLMIPITAVIDADESLQPAQVRAIFRGAKGTESEGREFTALMSYDPVGKTWSGDAKIDISGTYNLEYLVLDGDYNDLADNEGKYPRTFVIYLGLTARVWCEGIVSNVSNNSYDSTTFEYTEPATIGMQVKIYDNSGNEMPALTNVVLYYHNAGSSMDQDGMYGSMNWNESTGYYDGDLLMKSPGIYSFNRVTVTTKTTTGESTSVISRAENSPVFTAMSPEPPAYKSYIDKPYQFVPDGGATIDVNIKYAEAATVYAVIADQNGKEYIVRVPDGNRKPSADGYQTFLIPVPTNAGGAYTGKQDGQWTLTALCFQNVYANEKMYTATESVSLDSTAENYYGNVCFVIDKFERTATTTDEIKTYVVQTVNVEFDGTYSDAAGTATGKFDEESNAIIMGKGTHNFMDTHTTNVTFKITDWNKTEITGIGDVKWTVAHNGDQVQKGGYSGGGFDGAQHTLSGSGTTYTSPTQTLQLAGTYPTTLSFNVGGTPFSVAGPKYEVWSNKPSVTVSGVGTTSSIPTQITWKKVSGGIFGSNKNLEYTLTNNKTNQLDVTNNTVTVYAEASTDIGGSGDAGFKLPTLKFTVAGVDDLSTVKFTIPAGSANAIDFSQAGNGESGLITLGKTASVYSYDGSWMWIPMTCTVYGYSGHGDQTIREITIAREGVTYTVVLDKSIVIHNPSSVNQTK